MTTLASGDKKPGGCSPTVNRQDAKGRRCATLFSGGAKAGNQTLPLDTRRLANGVYFLRLEAGTERHSARPVVAR